MTDGEKATALLNYLETECDSKTAVRVLEDLIEDEPLARRYDELVEEGIL